MRSALRATHFASLSTVVLKYDVPFRHVMPYGFVPVDVFYIVVKKQWPHLLRVRMKHVPSRIVVDELPCTYGNVA